MIEGLANRLGRWKRKITGPIECTLLECTLTRGKKTGWKSFINDVQAGNMYSEVFMIDKDVYEVVQQWKTNQNCTISAIVNRRDRLPSIREDALRVGMKIRITEYGCVWHLLHRWTLMLNGFLYTGKLLDVGSSVEVYPQRWRYLE